MLNALELENFKGTAVRQRIDFAPLTLLFGANSAGKSTILQALLYLHELLERSSADIDHTELGGNVLELGGFARIVHRHEMDRAIVLHVDFATPGGLGRFGRGPTHFSFPDLDDEVDSAWLEVTVRFRTSPTFHGPLVERALIRVNGIAEPVVGLETGTSLRDGEPLHDDHISILDEPSRLTFLGPGPGRLSRVRIGRATAGVLRCRRRAALMAVRSPESATLGALCGVLDDTVAGLTGFEIGGGTSARLGARGEVARNSNPPSNGFRLRTWRPA